MDENIDGIEKFFKLTTSKGLSLRNVHLYNNKGHIKKYNNLSEIYDDFYSERYELYVKRKEYELSEYNNELMILKSKMRFIQGVIDDKIVVYRRKKCDIVQDLLKHEYIQVHSGRVIESVNTIDTSNYDYLIKMSLHLFTEEEINRLSEKINNIQDKYNNLQKRTIEEIWISECDELLKSLKK